MSKGVRESGQGKAEYARHCVCIGGSIPDGDSCIKCGRPLRPYQRPSVLRPLGGTPRLLRKVS